MYPPECMPKNIDNNTTCNIIKLETIQMSINKKKINITKNLKTKLLIYTTTREIS